jgi:hypothetical protein
MAGLVVLAGTLSVSGTAAATPSVAAPAARPASALQPTIAVKTARSAWSPARNYAVPPGSYFSFPNAGKANKYAIRNRVLFTIQGVWGGPRDRNGLPLPSNGSIRIASWSFNDMALAKALVAAHRRGASVQITAAASRNKGDKAWRFLKKNLGQRYYKAGVAGSAEKVSYARDCRGACRGSGGTPHSKFFLFDNVGASHKRRIVMQTSMNLTKMGFQGQWNQSRVFHNAYIYDHFMRIFREMRLNQPVSSSYRRYSTGPVLDIFFPFRGATATTDPVMQALNQVRCAGATAGGSSRTQIRIIQYAIYDNRGVWIAKKLRSLWNAGCNVQIIYAIATRPVLQILRNGSGRGAIPMRQSVITNGQREIVKYNHSKWMTIAGNWGSSTGNYVTFTGSANWSSAAFGNDEQMQQIVDYNTARAHLANFGRTWAQRSSHAPGYGIKGSEGRLTPQGNSVPWGQGAFKYLSPEGG